MKSWKLNYPEIDEYVKRVGRERAKARRAARAASLMTPKEQLVRQIEAEMKRQGMNKATLVRRLRTSKAQVDRLLDPLNTSLTLRTAVRVATILGKDIHVSLT